jgi:5-methylcytosine-specific restriction enzyme B
VSLATSTPPRRSRPLNNHAGPFLRLCREAEGKKAPAVLIIDEINRGNLPKLLGELIYALEYRVHKVRLPFCCDDRDDLIVSKNLYIIATMNSSDRSIGHIDVAVQRRFGLYPSEPQSGVVRNVWKAAGDEAYGAQLAALMDRLNEKLRSRQGASAAVELGVGQSYFLPTQEALAKAGRQQVAVARQQAKMRWMYQVQPLLREYNQLLPGDDSLQDFFNRSLEECLAQS